MTRILDWTLILGRGHLDRTLRIYADHYNRQRPHRALGLAPDQRRSRVMISIEGGASAAAMIAAASWNTAFSG